MAILLCTLWAPSALADTADERTFTFEQGNLERTVTVTWLKQTFPTRRVTVLHPLYGKDMTFESIPLAPVLDHLGWTQPQIRFRCVDGYRPVVARADVAPLGLALAIAEHPLPKQGHFSPLPLDRGPHDPSPFMVIATTPKSAEELPDHTKFSWPYEVVSVSPFDASTQYDAMVPVGAPEGGDVAQGYATFRTYCLSCHGVNLQGGVVGPELNIPKNITEYRDPAWLAQFIANPSAWRARDKMPGFGHLGEAKIKQVVAYLAYMKDHKRLDALP
ncbi:MAG: c-type cytochrome [Bradymonadia bacterium]